jgi:ferrous iron transport protein B
MRWRRTEAIDAVLTHPVVGVIAFFMVMFLIFATIFWIAQYPMDWIETFFTQAGQLVSAVVPERWGDLRSLLTDGVIGGVGGMLVFLPQICILFFFLSLLEDTGYLARAAFVMDRLMRKVGLPGKAFVPMLSAHACAIPAIMASRVIDDKRDRLVTILVLPLMTCSARIPVYAMVVALLFRGHPVQSAMVFTVAYSLGIIAALTMAFLFKKTILKGESKPLVLELPSYKLPSLRNALLTMYDRALIFIRKAGTIILLISIALWALAKYPKSDAPATALDLAAQARVLAAAGQSDAAAELNDQAELLTAQHALANSFAGRAGQLFEPVLRPLGFDWRIGVGIISSFAAREVIVSTLAIVYGVGADTADDSPETLYDRMNAARRADGTPVFTTATCWSLLVFYVLAMQCLPTQAITRRETNSRKWPAFQFVYMTVLAYVSSLLVYQVLSALNYN